jgi:hypothetical protein
MKKAKLSYSEQVTEYIAQLPQEIQASVEYLRQVMLSINDEISEHIKWNSPAFYYSGTMKAFNAKEYKSDILVMNLRKEKIMCVLPTGIYLTKNTEILEGNYTDGRRLINFQNVEDIKAKESIFRKTIQEWLSLIEK